MVFAIAIMTAKGGGGLTPAQIALCLTYMTQIVQVFGMVRCAHPFMGLMFVRRSPARQQNARTTVRVATRW